MKPARFHTMLPRLRAIALAGTLLQLSECTATDPGVFFSAIAAAGIIVIGNFLALRALA